MTTIRSQTELVLVPVAVTDKSGAHIPDLQRREFEVSENGETQEIKLFEEVLAARPSARLSDSSDYTNHVNDEAARRIIVILLDLLNTPYLSQQHARNDLLKILSSGLNDDNPKALLVLSRSGITVIHDFTTDPAVLAAALRKAKGDPATPAGVDINSLALEVSRLNSFAMPNDVGWDSVRQRESIDTTLHSLQDLARAFAGLPGRKALIWASAGFPFLWNGMNRKLALGPSLLTYEKTWQLLSSANVAVYSVDVRGLIDAAYGDVSVARQGAAYVRWAERFREASTTTLIKFAHETGGESFVEFGNPAEAFRLAFDDSRSYYLLGYYLDPARAKPGWHKLRVKVARSGTHVRARDGFLVPESPEVEVDAAQVALTSPLNYTAVPLALRLEPATDLQGKKHAEFALTLGPGGFTIEPGEGNHARLEITAGVVDAQGVIRKTKPQILDLHLKPESMEKVLAGGLVYRNAFDVAPGEYTARIVVRDCLSGRVGSVSAPLRVSP